MSYYIYIYIYNTTINYEWMDLMWHIVWMNERFNVPNNMDEWIVWHITMVAMCWWEIQNLNYSWKLLEMMSTCIVGKLVDIPTITTYFIHPWMKGLPLYNIVIHFELYLRFSLIFFSFLTICFVLSCFYLGPTCVSKL